MINLNKKQVGAFLKVMGKDDMRPALMVAKVELYRGEPVMVATNGYLLAAMKLGNEANELLGRQIRRSAIEKWYKLAVGKSRLTDRELVHVSNEDYAEHGGYVETNFPEWTQIVPKTEKPQAMMRFNADYFKIVQDLDGVDAVQVKLYGELAPMVCETERGLYLVMPMKA